MADEKYVDNSSRSSNVDSLIEKLRLEISKDSDDDFINSRKLTIQSTVNPQDITNEAAHDIDKEITELENLIKRLQAEIVEMTESASKPLQEYYPEELREGNAYIISHGEEHMSPIQKNEKNDPKSDFTFRKGESDVIFPVILKDDGLLEEQAKMFAEKVSNSINNTNNADSHKDAIDDVRRNFSVLWDDAPNSNDANANIPKPTISETEPRPLIDQALEQSIPESDLKFVSNVPKPPDETATIIAQVELTDNVNTSLQDENIAKTIESDNDNIPKTVIGNISEIANERATPDLPVKLNNEAIIQNEAVKNSPDAENLTTNSKDKKTSRPASVESKKSIRKPSKKSSVVISSSSNTNKSEKIISTILPNETSNTNQATTGTPEKPVSVSESKDSGIIKTVNKKLSKIVGRKDSINNDTNETKTVNSSTSDGDMSKKNRKSASKIKSKDSLAQDDKDTNKNVTVANSTTNKSIATHDSQNSINKGNRKPIRKAKSRSSISQSSINKAKSRNSSAERLKPVRSKSATMKPLDSNQDANITKAVSNIVQNKHTTKDDLTNTVNTKTINTTDGPQVVETENIFTKSEIKSTQLPVAVAQEVSNPSVISKDYTDLSEDLKTDTKDELTESEVAKEVNTVIVTEDFGTEVVEDELEGEEDLTDEGDLSNDNELVPDDEDEEMMDCADEEDNTYDVD